MATENRICYQINLQLSLGGGEIFTRFQTAALHELGYTVVLFVHADAPFWSSLIPAGVTWVPVRTLADVEAGITQAGALVITHSALPVDVATRLASRTLLTGMLHMPLYDRFPAGLPHYRRLFAVSRHVIASAIARGLKNVHSEPLYGVADLAPRMSLGRPQESIMAKSPYDWDRRKFRDRVLGSLESLGVPFTRAGSAGAFVRRPGLTLGLVSRITPIKQFPLMFSILSPVLARHPSVSLEIFGSGGYASVRDLKRALVPMRRQVRLWGQQDDVARLYPMLDYVLSGLPEKEALGLNLIEAQCCNTPVLAVRAPPFTESVEDGVTGFLFEDPRLDRGRSFEALLERLLDGAMRPEPRRAAGHLAQFSHDAFRARLAKALEAVTKVPAPAMNFPDAPG